MVAGTGKWNIVGVASNSNPPTMYITNTISCCFLQRPCSNAVANCKPLAMYRCRKIV